MGLETAKSHNMPNKPKLAIFWGYIGDFGLFLKIFQNRTNIKIRHFYAFFECFLVVLGLFRGFGKFLIFDHFLGFLGR